MSSEPFTFTDLTYLLLFLLAVWVAGRLSKFVGCPSIVGEVLIGSLLGPPLANFAPFPNALALLGEVGLVLLIVEGGLETDLALLKAVGAKGVLIAFCGSVFGPFLIGIGFATALGSPVREALAVGAALSPTSLACALSILKAERVLNTPVGQSILAAAVVDDVIALVLLSELAALNAPSASSFAVPIAAAIGFVLGVGAAAVHVVPVLLSKLVPFIPPAHVEDSVVMLLALTTIGLMAALHAGQASNLLGAFLAGVSFCTFHSVHSIWRSQLKRIQTWLVRIFFAATVGFQLPIATLWTGAAWKHGLLFFCALVGKVATGLLAGTPLTMTKFLTVGFAMLSLGEIAFLIAVTAEQQGLMSADAYKGVMIAILLSLIIGPAGLRFVLARETKRAAAALDALKAGKKEARVFYRLNLRCADRWGLLPDLLRALAREGVDVLECRVDSDAGRLALVEAFLQDTRLTDDAPATPGADGLGDRLSHLRAELLALLAHDALATAATGGDVEQAEEGADDGGGGGRGGPRGGGGGGGGDASPTVDVGSLRGLRLVRWLPGAVASQWAHAGLVGNEEAALTIMREQAAERHRNLGGDAATQHTLLKDVAFPAEATEAGGEGGDAAAAAGGDGHAAPPPKPFVSRMPSDRIASRRTHSARSVGAASDGGGGGDGARAPASQPGGALPAPPRTRLAPAASVDRAISAAAAAAADARLAAFAENDTLVGLVRRAAPRGLERGRSQYVSAEDEEQAAMEHAGARLAARRNTAGSEFARAVADFRAAQQLRDGDGFATPGRG